MAKGLGKQVEKKNMKGPHLTKMQTHMVATVGEFVGTFLFLYFAYAGNLMAASRASSFAPNSAGGGMSSETVIFISLAYSLSLLVAVWAFYRISGGLFNPAVSLASHSFHASFNKIILTFPYLDHLGTVHSEAASMDTRGHVHTRPVACKSLCRWSCIRHVSGSDIRGQLGPGWRYLHRPGTVHGDVLYSAFDICGAHVGG